MYGGSSDDQVVMFAQIHFLMKHLSLVCMTFLLSIEYSLYDKAFVPVLLMLYKKNTEQAS